MRQIVCNLTDDGSNELLDELQKGQPLLDDGCSSDDELDDWENWMPDPVDADPSKIHRTFQNCIYKKLLICQYMCACILKQLGCF